MTTLRRASFEDVVEAIRRERARQDAKWGTIDEHPHSPDEWLAIVSAELGEAYHEWMAPDFAFDEFLREVVHVAATACACLEQHGLPQAPDCEG